jgi:hypothetical protein
LALAQMFQDNSGRRSYDSQPSMSQTFVSLIPSGYPLTGFERVRLLDKWFDPVFRLGYSRSDTTVMHRKDDFSDHMTLGEALMRFGGPGEGIAFRDRNPELRGQHRRVQSLEFANA